MKQQMFIITWQMLRLTKIHQKVMLHLEYMDTKMQQEMEKAQADVENATFSATAGGGVVKATVSGKRQLLSLTIDKDAVDPEEVEMLQDMIVAAVNDALKKGEETRESEMSKIGGAGMGGMF